MIGAHKAQLERLFFAYSIKKNTMLLLINFFNCALVNEKEESIMAHFFNRGIYLDIRIVEYAIKLGLLNILDLLLIAVIIYVIIVCTKKNLICVYVVVER